MISYMIKPNNSNHRSLDKSTLNVSLLHYHLFCLNSSLCIVTSLSQSAVAWSAVCGCVISWSSRKFCQRGSNSDDILFIYC